MGQEEFRVNGEDVLEKVKEIVKEGMARRIIIKNEKGQTVIEVPLAVGLGGIALLPVWAAIGAATALITNCTIVVEKEKKSS